MKSICYLAAMCTIATSCLFGTPLHQGLKHSPQQLFKNNQRERVIPHHQAHNKPHHHHSSSSSHTSEHTFDVPVVFDLEDSFWNQFTTPCGEVVEGACTGCAPLDLAFDAVIQVTTIGHQVYLQIPALNFTIPETQDECYTSTTSVPPPPGGYVYLKDSFLPKKIRPYSVTPLTFTIQSSEYPPLQDPPVSTEGMNYELQIDTEGRIKIAGQGFNPIPPGRHSLLPTSVSYIVRKSCLEAPKNVPVSLTPSIPNNSNYGGQFLEIQMNSFEDGKVAFTFGDNSGPNQPILTKCKIAVADVVTKHGKPALEFNVPQHTYNPMTELPPYQYGTEWFSGVESDVAINPIDTNNMVWTGVTRVKNDAEGGLGAPWPTSRFACVTQYTLDGGFTWSAPSRIDFDNNSRMRTDVRLRADNFGNFWAIYGNMGPLYDPNTDTGVSMIIFVSSDGGATWTQAAEVLPPNTNNFGFDYPMLHWGGDGNGGYAMYFDWNLYDYDGEGNTIYPQYMAYIPVNGLGSYGSIQVINNFPQLDNFLSFGEIIATPDGRVVFGSNDINFAGFGVPANGLESHAYLVVHEGGINNFTPEGFSEPRLVDFNTIGETDNGQHNVVWQTPRGILYSVGTQGLAYDTNLGRLYALTLSELNPRTVASDGSTPASLDYNQGVMNLTWSYDFGKTWSKPVPIRDSKIGQAGICTLNVDQTTGNIACGWYDPREDAENQQEIKWYATVLAPPEDHVTAGFELKAKPPAKKAEIKKTQPKKAILKTSQINKAKPQMAKPKQAQAAKKHVSPIKRAVIGQTKE